MIELFEAVERCELGSVNIAVTALEPEISGEKALISNGQIVWKSSAKSFLTDEKRLSVAARKRNRDS